MNKEIKDLIINNQELDKIYFSVINDITPKTALDIGMYLKRNGSVSRASGGLFINKPLTLDGVDIMPDLDTSVSSVIYDHILSLDEFITKVLSGHFKKRYDLIIAFDICHFIDKKQAENIIPYLINNSRCILLDKTSSEKLVDYFDSADSEKITYDEADLYHIL